MRPNVLPSSVTLSSVAVSDKLALAAQHGKLDGLAGPAPQEFDPLRPALDRLAVAANDAVAGREPGPLGRRVLDDRTDDGRRRPGVEPKPRNSTAGSVSSCCAAADVELDVARRAVRRRVP